MHTIGRGIFEEIEELRALLRDVAACDAPFRTRSLCGLCHERIKTALSREAGAGAREKVQGLSGTPAGGAALQIAPSNTAGAGPSPYLLAGAYAALLARRDDERKPEDSAFQKSARTPQEQPSPRSEPAK